ncbi:MAG TPA: M24 family metallopeptidase [Ktedonobacteraceae bacterium]
MALADVQQALRQEGLDGWLFYDFRNSNPIAYQILGLPQDAFYSRRWFYFVPAQGEPTALVSAVEAHVLRELPGKQLIFQTWREMREHLAALLVKGQRLAMEYSPMNAIPYIARVDAGTIELVRSFGMEIVSSANISQHFVACLSEEQVESHREAGRRLIAAKDTLFAQLGEDLRQGRALDEYGVQQRFAGLIREQGLVLADEPLVAVNGNASSPHYNPGELSNSPLRRGDLVLFDFWAHLPAPGAIFADYTWMGFVGTASEIPQRQREVFALVRDARDAGVAFVRQRLAAGEQVQGREADDVVRKHIADAGYGRYFVHRTGHNIGTSDHGNGANLDNFETQDERQLLPSTCCSVEPGIYLPEFGVRSEINLLIHERDLEITGVPAQTEITPLL